jgi:hypothetical protein
LASRQVSVVPAIMFGPNITANNNVQVSSWPLPNFPEINKAFSMVLTLCLLLRALKGRWRLPRSMNSSRSLIESELSGAVQRYTRPSLCAPGDCVRKLKISSGLVNSSHNGYGRAVYGIHQYFVHSSVTSLDLLWQNE